MEDFITESGDDYGKLRSSGRFKIQALAGNQMLAAVFVTSGWTHVKDPKGRAKSIGFASIGYMLYGMPGAIVATLAIILPATS